ncbi:MAG: hypothetical protein NZ789_08505, partial [Pseudomonadales bacterium]|nr:hypothetical protein [Pseudomonadales bacterium]
RPADFHGKTDTWCFDAMHFTHRNKKFFRSAILSSQVGNISANYNNKRQHGFGPDAEVREKSCQLGREFGSI